MKPRSDVDPHLHTLRSVARAAGRTTDLEGARFNLFAAFEACDAARARAWATACRAAVLALPDERGDLRELGLDACDAIEEAIGVES